VAEVFSHQFTDFDRIAAVFASAGIAERRVTRPFDWYFGAHGWPERTAAYLDGALALFIEAAQRALDRAGIAADAVDAVVTVSSTGIATPSIEAHAFRTLGFRPDVQRVPVFGLGCAGGVAGLAIGADLATALRQLCSPRDRAARCALWTQGTIRGQTHSTSWVGRSILWVSA
jgi:alkylresorcinol/alkylpyrone synthase